MVLPSPGPSTGIGVSSACSLVAASRCLRMEAARGRSNPLAAPTQSASRPRSRSSQRVRRSPTGGTAADDRRTWPTGCSPTFPARLCRVRSVCYASGIAQSCRSRCTPARDGRGGSRGSCPAHIPTARLLPRPDGAAPRRKIGKRRLQADTLSHREAGAPATALATISCAAPSRPPASRVPLPTRQLAGLPAAVPVVRSGIEPLCFAAELQALQLGDHQLQMLDFGRASARLFLWADDPSVPQHQDGFFKLRCRWGGRPHRT